ncbi:MAG: response regulator [Campylobacterota bacterium]|nr:response regulator [Campylobacterota bacterium]
MKAIKTLIVDDSIVIVKIIKKALLANIIEGFYFKEDSILTASDGMEAFETFAQHPNIELIISDINMPNLNGNEFVEILQDTNKIDDVNVLFVTTPNTKLIFSDGIKNKILGTIYKPFNTTNFNEKMHQLYLDKDKRKEELENIRLSHIKQEEFILKIIKIYLENSKLIYKEDILILNIKENFHDIYVDESEYVEIAYASLSLYLYELNKNHEIQTKKIKCIIKKFFDKKNRKKESLVLKNKFINTMKGLNEVDDFDIYTKEIVDKLSLRYKQAKNYKPIDPNLIINNFQFIIQQFGIIDCEFVDDIIYELFIELKEINSFYKYLGLFIKKNQILTYLPDLKSNTLKYNEIIARLKYIYKINGLLRQHSTGWLDSHIWQRAKNSQEILAYMKKELPNKMLNSNEYLFHIKKITKEKYEQNYKLDKKNVVIISKDLDILEFYKSIVKAPFDNWSFYAFASEKMIRTWLKTNKADVMVIDYSFSTEFIKDGMQLFRILQKSNNSLKYLANDKKLFIINSSKKEIEYTTIQANSNIDKITQIFLYN